MVAVSSSSGVSRAVFGAGIKSREVELWCSIAIIEGRVAGGDRPTDYCGWAHPTAQPVHESFPAIAFCSSVYSGDV
jgi:hypothetical protein